ncbi:hypothetical protein ACGF13_05395 [Kitasatospora sp. NPDC048286]|uniref:hypothetical protein n=1 Tax=Kitasatospora sp. NPDC048286 TaxID=3364047 RepID=UPI003721E19C
METDEGAARQRRLLRPRLVIPAALAVLVLVGGSVWAVSGGGGSTASAGSGATATAEPSVTPPAAAQAQPSPSPSAVPEPAPASASASVEPEREPESDADEPGSGAPSVARKPTGKAEPTPAAKPQGASTGKPKAPAAQDPHNLPPTACADCHTNPQEPDPQHTCIHDAAGRILTCSPVQIGTPIPRPGQTLSTPTPGRPDHTH